MNLKNQEIFR